MKSLAFLSLLLTSQALSPDVLITILSRTKGEFFSTLFVDVRRGEEAVHRAPFTEAIRQCQRVVEIGDTVDPIASLNPAIKTRAAAREAMKHLNALRDGGA